jgi:4a-hydroxytetrahydrobiopterin dehydratase
VGTKEKLMSDLSRKRCEPCTPGTPALSSERIGELLQQLNSWELSPDAKKISRSFGFNNFHETMAFVNALAWVAHREDHHPDLEVSYKTCVVRYWTHTVNGLSENDFICAAKLDALVA